MVAGTMHRTAHLCRPRARRLCQHAGMLSHHELRRRTLCLALLSLCSAARAAPPLRNLSVEMRVSEDQFEAQRSAQGSVSIGSRGRADAGGSVVVGSTSSRQGLDATQRVLVLNGGRATLRMAQGLLVDDTEIWWTPWGPGAAVRSQWVELSNGMEVRPQWPGGDAPVTLEVAAQRSAPVVPAPQGTRAALPAQWTVVTTVLAPLGEWVTVAQVAGRQSSTVSGGGFGASTASRQRELQVRVSLP